MKEKKQEGRFLGDLWAPSVVKCKSGRVFRRVLGGYMDKNVQFCSII